MIAWIADFFRFWWALFYWNARKTAYIAFGRQGVCPCQHPSDSGKSGQTGCEAALSWNRKRRFRHVCPLIRQYPDGWLCSADRERIRPYWGRAFGFSGAFLLALYLLGTSALFLFLRGVGYESLGYRTVAWPPQWSEFRNVQATYYEDKAFHAFAEQEFELGLSSLAIAFELRPHNIDIGLQLARLWQMNGQYGLADRVFTTLLESNRDEARRISIAWYDSLLVRPHFAKVAELAAHRLLESEEDAAAWTRALLHASRRMGSTRYLQEALGVGNGRLPPGIDTVLRLETAYLKNDPSSAVNPIRRVHGRNLNPFLYYYQVERQIQQGQYESAQALLNAYADRLPAMDRVKLQLDLYAARGWRTVLRAGIHDQLEEPLTPKQIEVIGGHLIRRPDPEVWHVFYDSLDRVAMGGLPFEYLASLIAAAAVNRDESAVEEWLDLADRAAGQPVAALHEFAAYLLQSSDPTRIHVFLRTLFLPREIIYAFYERNQVHSADRSN